MWDPIYGAQFALHCTLFQKLFNGGLIYGLSRPKHVDIPK